MRNYTKEEQKLVSKLIKVGINMSCKGFNYILDAINIIKNEGNDIKITAVYYMVAEKNGSSYRRVERNIRSAVERVYTGNNVPSFLAPDDIGGKLTNGEFLFRLAYWL